MARRHQAKRGLGNYIPCAVCGKDSYASPKQAAVATFRTCSKECRVIYSSQQVRTKIPCKNCGKEVEYRKCDLRRIKSPSCSFDCALKIRSHISTIRLDKNLTKEQKIFKKRVAAIKHRALQKGWDFDLDYKILENMFETQKGLCHYTGLSMQLEPTSRLDHSMAFSVDRIDSNLGYTKNNVVLCLTCVNSIKNNMTLEQFKKIAEALHYTLNIKDKK